MKYIFMFMRMLLLPFKGASAIDLKPPSRFAMKLPVFLLAFSLISAIACAQEVTLNVKNAKLTDVLTSVRKQTGYAFLFQSSIMDKSIPVTIILKSEPLKSALEKIFDRQPYRYVFSGRAITIVPKIQAEPKKELEQKSGINITGKVTDELQNPLIGVSVLVKGTVYGTVTDQQGRYILSVPEVGTLLFTYIGYLSQELPMGSQSVINVQLKAYTGQLKETVVKGYYATTRQLNTGNVSSIKADEIAKQPVNDPLTALAGKVSGLYIAQTSGVPGAGLKINLRGQNSIANGNSPLFIVDGIPFNSSNLSKNSNAANSDLSPFTSIRPEDIESIDVLKDADATAIYGSRGANGVILITTKRGKAGKTKIDATIYTGIGQVARRLKLMNTQQYLSMRREGFKNDDASPQDYDHDVNGDWDTTRYTDWQKTAIGGTAHITNVSVSLSGGNENTQFLTGLSYRRESTVFPGDYRNILGSGNLNIRHNSENKKFQADISLNYSLNTNRLPLKDFTEYVNLPPNTPKLYTDNGTLNWENSTFDNPFGNLKRKSTATTDNLISNIVLSYRLTSDLQFKSSFGYSRTQLKEININPFSAVDPAGGNAFNRRSQTRANNEITNWIIEPQVNYAKSIGIHHFDVMVGTTFQNTSSTSLQQRGTGFSSDALIDNFTAANQVSNLEGSNIQYRYTAIYARLGYHYQNKYVLNLTGRRDGSSRFGPGNRFGNFGAIGAAWVFSQEEFIKSLIPVLSSGKLRGSIGKTGNDQLPDYAFLSTYAPNPGGYGGISTLYPAGLSNPQYGWETINKIEGALELGFLKDRLLVNLSYYRNRTSNQLVGYSLPQVTGFSTVLANLPATLENKGFEIEFNSINLKTDHFSWTSSLNLSVPKNKLISFPGLAGTVYATRYVVGQPLDITFVYKSLGLDPSTGIYAVEDLNHDGEISANYDRIPIYNGKKFFGGLSNAFSYKNFSLDVSLQFVKQIGHSESFSSTPGTFGSNQLLTVLDRWKSPSEPGQYQRYTATYGDAYFANDLYNQSDVAIVDASFIRLKNIVLSWMLPEKMKQRIHLQNLRLFLQAQNLFTITNFQGLDPENISKDYVSSPMLPPLRTLTVGVQISL